MKCNPNLRDDCRSDEEITQWLRRKFIMTVINNERFDPTVYTDERVVRESILEWTPIKSTVVEETVNIIKIQRLELQDSKWLQLGEYTREIEDFFFIGLRLEYRPFEFPGTFTHAAISYEFDLKLYVTERRAGSYFDWISSAGGMNKGLRLLFRVVVGFFSYNVYSVYMVSQFFKQEH